MKRSTFIRGGSVLALGALLISTTGSVKNPVERPYRVNGYQVWTIDLATGDATVVDGGVNSHGGRFTDVGTGHWILPDFTLESSEGTATVASGEVVHWINPGERYMIEFTGGTGRFQNVTGGFDMVMSEPEITFDDGETVTIAFSYTGKGTATY